VLTALKQYDIKKPPHHHPPSAGMKGENTMKRKSNIKTAAAQIRKEYAEVAKITAQIEKLQDKLYEIKSANNWMNYTGESFSTGFDWMTDEGQELLKMINAISK
jgi:hypothetical protein